MADNTDLIFDDKRITKLIKKVLEDEFNTEEQNLEKIIRRYLEITVQEIKSLNNEVNELKRSIAELTHNN